MNYEIGSVMTHEVFNYSQNGHIAVLTINRPEARNALNPEVLVKLATAWKRVRDDENIRVAVICGTGPAFCAGMDLGRMIPLITGARPPEDEWDEAVIADPSIGHRALLRDFDTEKPVIAAINGFAIAGGMELVMGCDLRVAADTAKFGLQEVKWAIFPGGGSTVRLPRQVPYSRAMEILLTGEQFTAERMLDYGFLNYVVPAQEVQEVLDKAVELAEKIAGNGPLAVTAVRRSVREAIGVPEARALERESEISATVYATEDAREGPRAFMEKRKPVFKGR
jgi:enoyl-CoA hydratase